MSNTIKTYNEAVMFIEGLANVEPADRKERDLPKYLKNLREFLDFIGFPDKNLKIIRIAGTSGKGSTASAVHSILISAGKKTGLNTSPHTSDFVERIKVGKSFISKDELLSLTNFLKNKMDEFVARSGESLNFFGFVFALAIHFFNKKKCEYVVLEAGMGARFDCIKVVEPICSILTNISKDHLEILGSLENIAYEKAGVISSGAHFITGEEDSRWLKIINSEAKKSRVSVKRVLEKDIKILSSSLDGLYFLYQGKKFKTMMLGDFQAKNMCLAIECARALGMTDASIRRGIKNVFYAARMEIVSRKPLVMIDSAHNEDKLLASFQFLKKLDIKGKKILIFACALNKDISFALPRIFDFFDIIYLTRFSNPFRKCHTLKTLSKIASKIEFKNKIKFFHYAKDAFTYSLTKLESSDLLLITGSIFLAGEARNLFGNSPIKNNFKI